MMEDEAGRLVCEGAAFRRRPDVLTQLRRRLAEKVISPAGSLLSRVKAGRTARGIASVISNSRLARDLPAVEPVLALAPPHAAALNGGIEFEMIDGPIWADTPYTCNTEVPALGRTPRAGRLWYQSAPFKDTADVARLLMLSRFLCPARQVTGSCSQLPEQVMSPIPGRPLACRDQAGCGAGQNNRARSVTPT